MRHWLTTRDYKGFWLALPTIFWLSVFFLLPLGIMLYMSFLSRGDGTGELPYTLAHYERSTSTFSPILIRSIRIALITTFICLLIGYPLAWFISTRKNYAVRQLSIFLIILPFWTNFLIRTYAWRILLGQEGTINGALLNLGIINEPLSMLNTEFAVIVGLVYGFFPFMVLPIFASVERFDFRFIDAAHDLGADDIRTFLRVVFPLTLPGVYAGCALVFIPSVGAYVTPDLLGGTRGLMIGNLIQRQFGGSGNWPLGSAMSIIMMGVVMISLLVYVQFGVRRGRSA
jgi:spermidine/putrescine transport system permease protein